MWGTVIREDVVIRLPLFLCQPEHIEILECEGWLVFLSNAKAFILSLCGDHLTTTVERHSDMTVTVWEIIQSMMYLPLC